MEEFNERIGGEAKKLFQTTLPNLCDKFHEMVSSDQFSDAAIPKVKRIIRTSCQDLVREQERKKPSSEHKLQRKKIIVSVSEGSDDEEFHTPMNSDSELNVKEPPCKKLKKEVRKRKATTKSIKDDSDSSESESDIDNNVVLECNPHINDMMDRLKPELRAVIECCNTVRAWVQLQVPAMQDGNNFGVEVQSGMLEEVKRVEDESHLFLQTLSLYHLTRADLASRFAKNTGVQDFVRALEELDAKEVISLRLVAREARNSCVTLLDSFKKNMEKIVCPRSTSQNMMMC